MPEHPHFEDDELFNRTTKHEEKDVPYKPLVWALVALTLFGILAHFVVWGLYKALASHERTVAEAPASGVPQPANAGVPQGQPLLQPFPMKSGNDVMPPYRNTPVADLISMHEAEAKVLNNYGWIDQQRGIARIPIEEAKKLIVQRGFTGPTAAPAASAVPASATAGAVPPATTPAPAAPATGAAGVR